MVAGLARVRSLTTFFDFAPLAPLRGEGLRVRGLIPDFIEISNAVEMRCIAEVSETSRWTGELRVSNQSLTPRPDLPEAGQSTGEFRPLNRSANQLRTDLSLNHKSSSPPISKLRVLNSNSSPLQLRENLIRDVVI